MLKWQRDAARAAKLRIKCYRSGKIRHESRAAAEQHAENLRRAEQADEDDRGRVTTYRCPFCRAWHVGHEGGG